MNTLIQNIFVFSALALALFFLVRKFIWKPKAKSSKGCGTSNCGCEV